MDESAAELLSATLQQSAVEVQGRPTLSLEAAKAAQERFGLSRRQVELAALEAGVAPCGTCATSAPSAWPVRLPCCGPRWPWWA